jgi:DNA polymerase IIIc chi subunit
MDNHSNGLQLLLSTLQAGTIFVTAVVEAVEEEHQRKRPKQDKFKEQRQREFKDDEALYANIKGTTLSSGKTIRLLLLV